jgi:hypothetical protein
MGEGRCGRAHDCARITLAGIRLFNGVAALFVQATLGRRLGVDPDANPAALYALRLFGVRTVLIGAELLLRDGGLRAHSLRVAPAIHALDATAALIHLPFQARTTLLGDLRVARGDLVSHAPAPGVGEKRQVRAIGFQRRENPRLLVFQVLWHGESAELDEVVTTT